MTHISIFGQADGRNVMQAVLQSDQLCVSVIELGAVTRSIEYQGHETILGHADLEPYIANRGSLGVIAGRVANRISNATFEMNGVRYQLAPTKQGHQLHGGPRGFSKLIWAMEPDSANNAVRLMLHSADGDQGFPNSVKVTVDISVKDNQLTYDMTAVPSGPTPINLAQHNYYVSKDLGMSLKVDAKRYLPVDDELIPTGKMAPVQGQYDLTEFRDLAEMARQEQHLDHCFVLQGSGLREAAVLRSSHGFEMALETDQPGVQVYTGSKLAEPFEPCAGVALEPEYFPNAVNTPGFGNTIHTPDRPYRQTTRLTFRPV